MPLRQLLLITPEELGWIDDFTVNLAANAHPRKWTKLLHSLVMMGVELPEACSCCGVGLEDWLHANHAEYNRHVRAAIMAYPDARRGLYKALYRDINGPMGPDDTYGRIALRSYGRELLDFLKVKPTLGWFKAPTTQKMYQGSALDNQERNPGLTH